MGNFYHFICYEKVEGEGPVSFAGVTNYYLAENEAKEFLQQRFATLGQQTDENILRDEDENPTGQHVVTYNIYCELHPEPDETDENRAPVSEMEIPF